MSSHHIVRENQEPALLIQDFQALNSEYLGQILEWSPTILSDDNNADFLISEGIKIDILFTEEERYFPQEDTKIIFIQQNYLHDAINYLIAHNYKAVNILVDRIDEQLQQYADKINIVLFCQGVRYVFVRSFFEKWKPKDNIVYISESKIKSFQGIQYVCSGVFQVEQDGFVRVEFNTEDFVLLGEEI